MDRSSKLKAGSLPVRTRWLVATLSCVSLAELNKSPQFPSLHISDEGGYQEMLCRSWKKKWVATILFLTLQRTHIPCFLVQVHCMHLMDYLMDRQWLCLLLLLHSMPPGQSCAWLHEEASPGYLPIKVRGSEKCHRFSLGGICPIPGHEFQSVLFLLMLHLSSLPCRFQVPASDMKMTDWQTLFSRPHNCPSYNCYKSL